jgi:branched-chain amino acid transport system permease protein
MNEVIIQALILAGIYALLGLSLNIQFGLAGLLNFGQVLFYAVGAYGVAFVTYHNEPVWAGDLGGIIAAGLAGALLALPVRLIPESFWSLMSLGGALVFTTIIANQEGIAGGAVGAQGIVPWSQPELLAVLAVAVLVAFGYAERIRRSQLGRTARAIRDDEVMVAALGRSVFSLRVRTLVVGGVIGGAAGVVYAHWVTFVSPDAFSLTITLQLLVIVVLGGLGNNYGILLGTVVVVVFQVFLQLYPPTFVSGSVQALLDGSVYGLLLIVVLLFRRHGLIRERRMRYADAAN